MKQRVCWMSHHSATIAAESIYFCVTLAAINQNASSMRKVPPIPISPWSDEAQHMNDSSPTFVDLFSGAGLFSRAFIDAGFCPKLAIERDKDASETYTRNVGTHLKQGDVQSVDFTGRCDLIVAGPPCQGFSTLNRNRHGDVRNELCLSVLPWIDKCRPSLVVIENVPPFLRSDVCCQLLRRLRKRGFKIATGVLDAAQFGTPQFRQRAILIASRTSSPVLPSPDTPIRVTVREAWKGLSRSVLGRGLHVSPEPSPASLTRIQAVPTGGDRRDIMRACPEIVPPSWWRLRPNDNTGVWGRMVMDEPSPTIRTCFQNPSKGRFLHPVENRTITLQEGARLQGFPNNWRFSGSRTSIARQIGNAVPLPLGNAVALLCRSLSE